MNEKMNGGISTMRGIFCRLSFQKGGITAETIAAQGFDGGIFSVDTRQNLTSSEVRFFCFAQKKDIVSFSGKNKKRERKNRSLFFHQIVAAYLALAAR